MKPGTYIVAVVIAGFVLIGYLFSTSPETAPNQLPLIIAAVAGLATLLAKQADTDTKVEAAAVISEKNAKQLTAVAKRVDDNTDLTETTHRAVNGQMEEFKKALIDVAALKEQVAAVLALAASAESKLAIANERERGISIGREQATQEAPAGSASIGGPTTIAAAGPTTIAPEGPVTIVMPPPAPVEP